MSNAKRICLIVGCASEHIMASEHGSTDDSSDGIVAGTAVGIGTRGIGTRGIGTRGIGTRGIGTRGIGTRGEIAAADLKETSKPRTALWVALVCILAVIVISISLRYR